jgi:hypothetical protein
VTPLQSHRRQHERDDAEKTGQAGDRTLLIEGARYLLRIV